MTDELPAHGDRGHQCYRDPACFDQIWRHGNTFTSSCFAAFGCTTDHKHDGDDIQGIAAGFHDNHTMGWGLLHFINPDQVAVTVITLHALAAELWGTAYTSAYDQAEARFVDTTGETADVPASIAHLDQD